jgi:NAD(P)-dependent dehydrogenase (short-subunit alcohol dehydrogenase family)
VTPERSVVAQPRRPEEDDRVVDALLLERAHRLQVFGEDGQRARFVAVEEPFVMVGEIDDKGRRCASVTCMMLRSGWGRIVNVSMNRETMRRVGFSPYGPSKAALESETAIWAQDLAGTGVTVNAILPGGATATGMIPDGVPDRMRASLLKPEVIVPALLWLASTRSDGITGKRVIANRWLEGDLAPVGEAMEDAGWAPATG